MCTKAAAAIHVHVVIIYHAVVFVHHVTDLVLHI